jgi:hypothetical protein
VKYLLLICGEESAAAHSGDGCGGWLAEMAGFCVIEWPPPSRRPPGTRPRATGRSKSARCCRHDQ